MQSLAQRFSRSRRKFDNKSCFKASRGFPTTSIRRPDASFTMKEDGGLGRLDGEVFGVGRGR